MRQFLLKALEVSRRLLQASADIAAQIVARLDSVKIDAPTGAILCVTLQMVLAISVLIVFRTPLHLPVKALQGTSDCQVQPVDSAAPGPSVPETQS